MSCVFSLFVKTPLRHYCSVWFLTAFVRTSNMFEYPHALIVLKNCLLHFPDNPVLKECFFDASSAKTSVCVQSNPRWIFQDFASAR